MCSEIIKQFNQILEAFIVQITPLVGSSYKNKFDLIVKVNCILPIEHFITHALPLREKILNRDESYFADSQVQKEKADNDEQLLGELLDLKDKYDKLDKQSQSGIWDFFQAMLYLGEEYIKLKLLNTNN